MGSELVTTFTVASERNPTGLNQKKKKKKGDLLTHVNEKAQGYGDFQIIWIQVHKSQS